MTFHNAMVLAAGLGTRLRPVTDTIPKPLVPIAGRPMIDHVLDRLADAGVKTVVVNVHHHADLMQAHLALEKRLEIRISDERGGLMNSGGGLARGIRLLDRSNLFVMNSDLLWIGDAPGPSSNLARLARFFDPVRMDMAMLCVAIGDTTGHNGKSDFSMQPDGALSRYAEGVGRPVVYAGVIAMNPALLDDAPDGAFNLNLYFDKAIAAGRLFGMMMQGHWLTVGTPQAIGEVEDAIARFNGKG